MLRPTLVAFVSYPYEWTFGQLKDAALLTLDLQEDADRSGFTLRDASAYNIQFDRGRPILIDSLSVEPREGDEPWAAYRQFCQHFLAPLALMARRDIRCGLMLRDHLDGIPLDLASTLLPARTRLSVGPASHVHLHARAQRQLATPRPPSRRARRWAPRGARRCSTACGGRSRGFLEPGRDRVGRLRSGDPATRTTATSAKEAIVESMLGEVPAGPSPGISAPTSVGSARSSRGSAAASSPGTSIRQRPSVTTSSLKTTGETRVLPLVQDLVNPSPGLGWACAERAPFVERSDADVILALALVHHLAISNNVPLEMIAALFAGLAPTAIVEFVPKHDPMVQRLLGTRVTCSPTTRKKGSSVRSGRGSGSSSGPDRRLVARALPP